MIEGTEIDDDGTMIPPLEERRKLQGHLTALVARDPAPLVTALLVEPNPRYFPDRWSGGEASVRRLLRRLCGYAGLPALQVEVAIYETDAVRRGEGVGRPEPKNNQEMTVWLAACDPVTLRVGIEAAALGDPLSLVAASARVVAHAYRVVHGLATLTDDPFDVRIDVTAVYLGFGLLTADAAVRLTRQAAGALVQNRRKPLKTGSLPPQGVCWLLAIQAHARALDRGERTRVAKAMQANQAAFFRHAYTVVERIQPPIAGQLGVPARELWPPAPSLAERTAPLPDEPDETTPEVRRDEGPGPVGLNLGKPVFIVDRSMAPRLGRVLFMGVLMLGGVASRMSPNGGLGMGVVAGAAIGLGLVGLLIGRLLRERRCSEPKCVTPLRADENQCPRCGGTIVGTISDPKQRLAAEEALHRAEQPGTAPQEPPMS